MLGKLLKHEWKSIWKIPAILLGLLLIISVLAGSTFTAPIWESNLRGLDILVGLLWLLFYFAIIGVNLGIMLYLAIHFYKSMFTDEGYLTHTLPVTSHQLLLSKMLPMMTWTVFAVLGTIVGLGIFGGMALVFLKPAEVTYAEIFNNVIEFFADAELWGDMGWIGFICSIIFLMIAGIINGAMTIIGSVSIGQLVNKHKILGSIGAYFAINAVIQTLSGVIFTPMLISNIDNTDSIFDILTPSYLVMGVIALFVSAGLYFISEYLIRHKLNLD